MKYLLLPFLMLTACGSGGGMITAAAPTAISDVKNYTVAPKQTDANTGVTYDSKRNEMLHAITDTPLEQSFIVSMTMDMKEVSRVNVSQHIRLIQGLAYDSKIDATWVWGTRLDVPFKEGTDCFQLALFDHAGNFITAIHTPIADSYPGMIALIGSDQIWFKANAQSIARLYRIVNGGSFKLIEELDTGIAGEGVALNSDGSLWVHGDGVNPHECFIKRIDLGTGSESVFQSPSTARCGAEGLAFDGSGHLWITTDDGYHYGDLNGNQAWEVSFK